MVIFLDFDGRVENDVLRIATAEHRRREVLDRLACAFPIPSSPSIDPIALATMYFGTEGGRRR